MADQCQYSCLVRERFESEYAYLFRRHNYGTTIWSPLCCGLLSGKYNDGSKPEGSIAPRYFGEGKTEKTLKLLNGLGDIAKEVGCTQAALCLAWTIVNKDVSTCILGASKLEQLEDNLKACEVAKNWTKELEEKMEKVLDNPVTPIQEARSFTNMIPRREEALTFGLTE